MEDALLFHLELKQRMTWRQINVVALARVPAANNQAPRVWIRFDLIDEASNLIDTIAFRIMAAERTPEISVNRAKVAGCAAKTSRVFVVGPLFPNVDATRAQACFVSVA